MKRPVLFLITILSTTALTGCAGVAPAVSPSATAAPPTVVSQVQTSSATPTISPSRTPTTSPTLTPSSSPGPDFQEASLLSVAHLKDSRIMISIEVPGGVDGVFDAYVGSSYLPCETPYQYPNRIICVGPEPFVNYSPEGAKVTLYPLYPDPEAPPLFEAMISVPARATPTATQPVWYPPLPVFP